MVFMFLGIYCEEGSTLSALSKEEIQEQFGYDNVFDFIDGFATVVKEGKFFHIHPDGTPAYEERYDLLIPAGCGLSRVESASDNRYFYIGNDGKPINEERYDVAGLFTEDRLALVKRGGECFHIRTDGTPAYKERYDWVDEFHHGRALVRARDGTFFIRTDGSRID
jgi:hypothetical protein